MVGTLFPEVRHALSARVCRFSLSSLGSVLSCGDLGIGYPRGTIIKVTHDHLSMAGEYCKGGREGTPHLQHASQLFNRVLK